MAVGDRLYRRIQCLGQAEIEDLHRAIRPHLHVGRFEVAMDDAALVRVFQPLGDLLDDVQGFIEANGERGPLTRSCDAGPPSPRGRGQVSLFLALPSLHGRGRTLCFTLPSPSGRGAGGEGIATAYALRQRWS